MLIGIGVGRHQPAMRLDDLAEVRALVARHHQRVLRQLGVLRADHLELDIGDDPVERHRRMLTELFGAIKTDLLAAVADEQVAALRLLARRQRAQHPRSEAHTYEPQSQMSYSYAL